ncbi:hypothetical protein KFU94_66600 [Chloroflexi bacterium TSY]|nr:hypothetical protein [Chloroflexi bacterium TSY]
MRSKRAEKLYAINENALYTQIKRKGKSVSRLLQRFEMVMIGANLLVGIALISVEFLNDGDIYEYLLPGIYFAYAVLAIVWRWTRRQEDISFEQTMLGELDKAIWQINYLISRSRQLILWYLTPLALVVGGITFYNGQPLLALAVILVMVVAGFITDRWEIKRCYLPKKRSLEALRTTLLAAEV